jgi:hypothetical protein
MIETIVTYLNLKLTDSGYINDVLTLAKRIEKAEQVYPAIYTNNGEYAQINLDSQGSLSYWRLTSDIVYSEQASTAKIGMEYNTTIPLRLVVFAKKEGDLNTAYFEERLVADLVKRLSSESAYLKPLLQAKRVLIVAKKNNIDGRILAQEEYEKVGFEPRYDWAYCSIDFEVSVISTQSCMIDLCDSVPSLHCGSVRIVDENGALIATVECGDTYVCSSAGGTVDVHNSDDTFQQTVTCGDELELEDIDFVINVNGVLNQSFSQPSMVDLTINISN